MSADHDPFEVLRLPLTAIQPAETFAADLRRRVAAELGVEPDPTSLPTIDLGTRTPMTTDTTTPTTIPTGPLDPAAATPPGLATFKNPSLVVNGGQAAVDFYQHVFGATISMAPFVEPDGRIGHIELDLGGAMISVADEYPEYDIRGPRALGGTPVALSLQVPTPADVDVVVDRAVAAGAEVVFPVEDRFYGERAGRVRDPWGHEWLVQGRIEDLTVDEMQQRFAAESDPESDPESDAES